MIGNTGNYSVAVTAKGYNAVDVAVNVIADSNASLLPTEWTTWFEEGEKGTLVELLADSLTLDFVETIMHYQWNIPETWSIQVKKENISTVDGKTYVLSFDTNLVYDDASITSVRDFTVETSIDKQVISVPVGESHFELEYTPGARNDFTINLLLGGGAEYVAPHLMTLSNIKLVEKAAGDAVVKEPVEAPVADSVKADVAEDGNVTLSWDAVEGVSAYGIYAADKADGNYVLVAETSESTYVVENLAAGTYYYAVAALAADEAHCASEIVKVVATIEEVETPVNPENPDGDDTDKDDDSKDETDKDNSGAGTSGSSNNNSGNGSSNNNTSSNTVQDVTVTAENSATEQSQTTQAAATNNTTSSEATVENATSEEVVENVEEEATVEEVEKVEEIADEEVPLANATAAESSGISNVLVVAIVIILLCTGAAALGMVFRKKDDLE